MLEPFKEGLMNKNDLISQVADDAGLSKVDATKALMLFSTTLPVLWAAAKFALSVSELSR